MRIPPALLLLAVAIVPAFTVCPAIAAPSAATGKCGTPQILETILQRGKIAQRPLLNQSLLSRDGHFRIHYNTSGANAPNSADLDSNSVPDYIDSTLAALEYAWDLEINVLGYKPPKGDNGGGGGDEIDVYIQELGNGNYGITYPDNMGNGTCSGYIILDNDYAGSQYYSKGLDGMRVTSAHEFFHVVQFGYLSLDLCPIWWLEQSATWMENRAWDGVNDYLNYLWDFFDYSHLPINSTVSNFEYGAVLWPMYLSNRFGDQIIRSIWETLAANPSRDISCFEDVIPTGLGVALHEFGVWNYFTMDRANTADFYPDGDLFPCTVAFDLSKYNSTPDSLWVGNLSSSYAELLFLGDWRAEDGLKVSFDTDAGLTTENSIVFYNSPRDYRIDRLVSGKTLAFGKSWNRAALVSTCTIIPNADGQIRFSMERDMSSAVTGRPVSAFSVEGAYPNPFNPVTTVRFTLPGEGKVTVKAYSVTGQKVADLFEGVLSAGEKNILWKPSGLSGGVYFVTVTSGFGTRTAKVLLLK